MRHQHTDHKCEKISDCSYSGKTLVEKRLFPDVEKIDQEFDPFHVTFTVTPEQKKKYDSIFNSLEPQAGLLSEEKVRNLLITSWSSLTWLAPATWDSLPISALLEIFTFRTLAASVSSFKRLSNSL